MIFPVQIKRGSEESWTGQQKFQYDSEIVFQGLWKNIDRAETTWSDLRSERQL